MKILEYSGLDTTGVSAAYRKVTAALAKNDFRAAQVKKLQNLTHGKFYRAKLDGADRLLFTLVRFGDELCALMLEVIASHNYDKSRFLRGAVIDESKIPDFEEAEAMQEAEPLRYLHPRNTSIHLLDKPVSFDEVQESVYAEQPPLIIVGSAGSGKTALTLEKLKHAEGEVLYVTHSVYLAQNARNLYYSNGFEHKGQEAQFLSYREFIESIRVPAGREAGWREFSAWFSRIRNAFREIDAHQAFEEIRGVITAGADGILGREEYAALGVRQSIFSGKERSRLYDLFEKYRQWLLTEKLFDLNIVAHEWNAVPRYDFVVIDEVQDLTIVQLSLVLKTLKKPGHFLLCGDSNQIVHPNFFSWSQVKSLFWKDPKQAGQQKLRVLTANFRNGTEATRIANQLLKIKQHRFGSIDRESNYLVQATGGDSGQVALMADSEAVKRDFNRKTKQSTRFAVLVMRDEDKAEARKYFSTPLLFSIHEAKGLEYDNIVLFRFVSSNRSEFNEITDGVDADDLMADKLEYNRAKDKSDKSLEVYKFFVNAMYVALTRAIKNIYIIESDTAHRLFRLLGLSVAGNVRVDEAQSTIEEWQKEARKLEMQGKQEQAEAIRRTILKTTPPPWQVFDEPRLREVIDKVFRKPLPGNKFRQQLYEYATCHEEAALAEMLYDAGFEQAEKFSDHLTTLGRKSYVSCFSRQIKGILKQCDQHGLDHRLSMNQTPLMAAAAAGNIPLTEALLERGADIEKTDHYGYNALHWAMRKAFHDPGFATGNFAALYELLAPPCVDVNTGERLVRIDRHLSEYFLFQTMWVLFKSRFGASTIEIETPAFDTGVILDAWAHMPSNVVFPERNKRSFISAVLSRNETDREYAWNRDLFLRVARGWYQFNPKLLVRSSGSEGGQVWIPVFQALNLPLIYEFSNLVFLRQITQCFEKSGMPIPDNPLCRLPAVIANRQEKIQKAMEKMRIRTEQERIRKVQERGFLPRDFMESLKRISAIEPDDDVDDDVDDEGMAFPKNSLAPRMSGRRRRRGRPGKEVEPDAAQKEGKPKMPPASENQISFDF